jgi:hypothetical protein
MQKPELKPGWGRSMGIKKFSMIKILVLTLAALMTSSPARAQTVEEAIFFMLYGFESGERVSEPLSQVKVDRLSLNRWSVQSSSMLGTFKNEVEIVADKDKCVYQVRVYDEANVLQQVDVFHFLNVTNYKAGVISMPGGLPGAEGPSIGTIDIYGNGLIDHYYKDASGRELQTQQNNWHRQGVAASRIERLDKAYRFFKERTGCEGRAF